MPSTEELQDFTPTRHLMYCAEQIVIPQQFPNILKNYAKAAIRTQPYDLLRWSAAYFRCLATNVKPPVKIRLEPVRRFGTLTRGYLVVLLEQVGKGFFVNRDILQNRWESLSLPQDELLSFLSLCRMLDWPQIHWLKLFAVLVGTLNNSLLDTLTMLCELLTEDTEGSPSPIPMWMAREIYTFLAELDCGSAQTFIGGRKVIGVDNELEPITKMPDLPKLMDLESFRNAILERFFMRLGIDNEESDSKHFPYRLDAKGDVDSDGEESVSSRPSHVSSSYKFIGDICDPAEVIRRTPDFDSVILLLTQSHGFKLHEYRGPHNISAKTLRHVQRREMERNDRIQHMHDMVYTNATAITQEEHDKLLKDIEPPWSWIHQFAATNCRNKSYNFLEIQSVASDETPCESSDESFDFENNRFYEVPKPVEALSLAESEEAVGVEDLLLKKSDDEGSVYSVKTVVQADKLIDDIITMVQTAVAQKEIELQNVASILSLLESCSVKTRESKLDLKAVREVICNAEELNITFKNLAEFEAFLRDKLPKVSLKTPSILSSESEAVSIEQGTADDDLTDEDLTPVVQDENTTGISPESKPAPSEPKEASVPVVKPLESQFEECMIEIDEKVTKKPMPDKMIIGIIPTPPPTPIIIPTPPRTITPPPPSPHNTSSGIITCNVSLHTFPEELKTFVPPPPRPPTPPKPFVCRIPVLPGIGAAVSRETIKNVVTFMKGRSRHDKGMVFPRCLRDPKCPNLIDTYEG